MEADGTCSYSVVGRDSEAARNIIVQQQSWLQQRSNVWRLLAATEHTAAALLRRCVGPAGAVHCCPAVVWIVYGL